MIPVDIKKKFVLCLMTLLILSLFSTQHSSAQRSLLLKTFSLSQSGYDRSNSLAFSPNGKYIAVGGFSTIYLIDIEKSNVNSFVNTKTWARTLTFLPDSNILAAGLFDNTIKFWDTPQGNLLQVLKEPKGWVRSISVSKNGLMLASASDDNVLRVWSIINNSLVLSLDKNTEGIRAVALSPNGDLVAGGSIDNSVRIWDTRTGKLLHDLKGHTDWVRCLAFSPDGSLLSSGSFDKSIRIWNIEKGTEERVLEGHSSSVLSIEFSPTGKHLASGSVDQKVLLWEVKTGYPIQVFEGHQDFVYSIAFSPDGNLLASGSGDNSVKLWSLEDIENFPKKIDTSQFSTPSDCRACHHRRGDIQPIQAARVIELSCEACHPNGASLAWCNNFQRTNSLEGIQISNNISKELPGIPINNDVIAVIITSPSNGETFYVNGYYLVPETIGGKIFYNDQDSVSSVEVKLDIIHKDQISYSQTTTPNPLGEFRFYADVNPGSIQAQDPSVFCRGCHERIGSGASLTKGLNRIRITATAPNGSQAYDERWFRVDTSDIVTVPIKVIDEITNEPLSEIKVSASTFIYDWRNRTFSAITDSLGNTTLDLERLSQTTTNYSISIPEQLVNGKLISGLNPVKLSITPEENSYKTQSILARVVTGVIDGKINNLIPLKGIEDINISAFILPSGPVFQTKPDSNASFYFNNIPLQKYKLYIAPDSLQSFGLASEILMVDLTHKANIETEINLQSSRIITGIVTDEFGNFIPSAYVTPKDSPLSYPIDPQTKKFFVSDHSSNLSYLTASAPGYYSSGILVKNDINEVNFKLTKMNQTKQIPWGEGVIIIPPESVATFDEHELQISIDKGWIWGNNKTEIPLIVRLNNYLIEINYGEFALAVKTIDNSSQLLIFDGLATIISNETGDQYHLTKNQIAIISEDNYPTPLDFPLVSGLYTEGIQNHIQGTSDSSNITNFRDRIIKTGIVSAQAITLITYILIAILLSILIIVTLNKFLRKFIVK